MPIALAGAFTIFLLHRLLNLLGFADLAPTQLVGAALDFTGYTLAFTGSLEMMRTVRGPARRGAVLAAASSAAVAFGILLELWLRTQLAATVSPSLLAVSEGQDWLFTAARHAFTAALLWCAWEHPRARKVAPFLGVASLLVFAFPIYRDEVPLLGRIAGVTYPALAGIALHGAIAPLDPFSGWPRMARAISLLRSGLYLQLLGVCAFPTATFCYATYRHMQNDPGLDIIVKTNELPPAAFAPFNAACLFYCLLILLLGSAVCSAALLRASGLAVLRAPRKILLGSVAVSLFALAIEVPYLTLAYHALPTAQPVEHHGSLLSTLLNIASYFLFAFALRRLCQLLEVPELLRRATRALRWVSLSSLLSLVSHFVSQSQGADTPVTVALFCFELPILIISMAVLARLCAAMAKALGARSQLPAAFVQR